MDSAERHQRVMAAPSSVDGLVEHMADKRMHRVSLLLISGFSLFRIGYQMVVLAWVSVQATGSAAAPGQILFAASLASLLGAPWMGRVIDRVASKRLLLISSHASIAVLMALSLPWWSRGFQGWSGQCALMAMAALTGVAASTATGAADYYIKLGVASVHRTRFLATLNSVNQMALILGTMVGGLVLSIHDSHVALWGLVMLAVLPALVAGRLLERLVVAPGPGEPVPALAGNLGWYRRYPAMLEVAAVSALVMSLAQVTNTLLPGLLGLTRKASSLDYAMVEMSWSGGALVVGMLLARFFAVLPSPPRLDLMLLMLMTLLLGMIPFVTPFQGLLAIHFMLGCGFAWVRIANESRFMTLCPTHLLGRFRANAMMINGALGLIIYAVPTLAPGWDVVHLYLSFSLALFMLAAAIRYFTYSRGRPA